MKNIKKNLNIRTAEKFFYYYEAKGWKFNNGNSIKINRLEAMMNLWESRENNFNNSNKFDNQKIERKQPEWLNEYIKEIQEMEG